MALSDAINTQNVTISVDAIVPATGLPEESAATMGCLISLGDYAQKRNVTDYECMSSNETTSGLGSIKRDPMEFSALYVEAAADAQQKLKAAFTANTQIEVTIEFDNSKGANGTQLTGNMQVSEYVSGFPKDGKITVTFSLVWVSTPVLTEAA